MRRNVRLGACYIALACTKLPRQHVLMTFCLSVCLLQCVSFAGTLHCLFDHHEHQGYCASYISTRRSIVLPNSVVFRLLANLREAVKFSYSTCDACVKCQLALRRPVASIRDIKTENRVGDFMRHLTYCLNASVSVLSMLHFVKTCTVYRNLTRVDRSN